MNVQPNKQTNKHKKDYSRLFEKWLKPTGIITSVWINELLPRECFCMLCVQRVNLFAISVVLCSWLRIISQCVIFLNSFDVGHLHLYLFFTMSWCLFSVCLNKMEKVTQR